MAIPVAVIAYWISVGYVPASTALGPDPLFQVPVVRGVHFFLLTWGLSAGIAGGIGLAARRSGLQMLGLGLMLVPVTQTLLGIWNSLGPLLAGGAPPPAFSEYALSGFFSRKFLVQVGYPAAGFLLYAGWRPDWRFSDIARRLREAGLPIGRSEGHSALLGWAFFPALLAGTIAVNVGLSRNIPDLVNVAGDGPYANMTVYHSILLSASAALGEEIVYRGLFLVGGYHLAKRVITGRHAEPAAWWTSWGFQAVVFGFAHASFNNPLLVIQATLFGMIAGYAALRYGILCAIMLHFLVDIYAFGVEVGGAWVAFLAMLLIVNVGVALWMLGRALLRRQAAAS